MQTISRTIYFGGFDHFIREKRVTTGPWRQEACLQYQIFSISNHYFTPFCFLLNTFLHLYFFVLPDPFLIP